MWNVDLYEMESGGGPNSTFQWTVLSRWAGLPSRAAALRLAEPIVRQWRADGWGVSGNRRQGGWRAEPQCRPYNVIREIWVGPADEVLPLVERYQLVGEGHASR